MNKTSSCHLYQVHAFLYTYKHNNSNQKLFKVIKIFLNYDKITPAAFIITV